MSDQPIRRVYGKEVVEVRSPQQARDMANNKALPLDPSQRDQLRRDADELEREEGGTK